MVKNICYFLLLVLFSCRANAENLMEAIKIAFDNNYDYKSKVESFNADYAYKGLANSYLLPKIDLQGNANLNRESKTYSSKTANNYSYGLTQAQLYELSVVLVQPLYNPSAWAYYSQGKLMAQKAQVNLDKGRNDLILKVAEAYFNVLSAKDDMEYAKAEIEYLENYMKEITQKANVGQAKRVDVDEVKAKYEAAKYNSFVTENNLKVRIDTLNKTLNTNISSVSGIKKGIESLDIKEKDISIWTERAKEQNLDILAGKLSLLLADEDIKIASSAYYPAISFVASVGGQYGKDPMVVDKFRGNKASVGLSLNMNLYGGGSTLQQRKQANYKKNSVDFALKELENNVENQTTQYYLNVANGLSQIDALEQSLNSSERFLDAAKKSYLVGLKTTTDVLIATESYFSAKRDYSKSKYSYLLSILALKAVSGVISDEDIALINNFLE